MRHLVFVLAATFTVGSLAAQTTSPAPKHAVKAKKVKKAKHVRKAHKAAKPANHA